MTEEAKEPKAPEPAAPAPAAPAPAGTDASGKAPAAPPSTPEPAPTLVVATAGAAATLAAPLPYEDAPEGRPIDWRALVPSSVGELMGTAAELALVAVVLMNAWAVSHQTSVSVLSGLGGFGAALVLVGGWRAYAAVVEARGARVLGITWAVLGVLACAAIVVFGVRSGTVHESPQLRKVIYVLGALFLYPAARGVLTAVDGREPRSRGGSPLAQGQVGAVLRLVEIPMNPRWYQTLRTLYGREMWSFFTTPIPYLVLFVFLAINGYLFFALVRYVTQPGADAAGSPVKLMFDNFFWWLSLIFIFPALTMRLVAEERSNGTIEALLTTSVTDVQVILSKYGAAMTFYVVMLGSTLGYLAMLSLSAREVDWGPIYGNYLGLVLFGALTIAVGLFWSTLTDSQLIAYGLAWATNVLLFFSTLAENFVQDDFGVFGWKVLAVEQVRTILHYVSYHTHYQELARGIVSTRAIVFFGSATLFMLFAAVRGLETQKWK